MDKLSMLLAVHHEFVQAAGLSDQSRPYGASSRLEDIGKQIMEEVKSHKDKPQATTTDDDIPF